MHKRAIRLFNITSTIIGTFSLYVQKVSAQVDPATGVYTDSYGDQVVTLRWVETMFQSVLGIMLQLIGIGAFVMLLIGGFQYLLSGGNPQAAEQARATIGWAVGGLALALMAWFIILLIARLTGNTNTLLLFQFYIRP